MCQAGLDEAGFQEMGREETGLKKAGLEEAGLEEVLFGSGPGKPGRGPGPDWCSWCSLALVRPVPGLPWGIAIFRDVRLIAILEPGPTGGLSIRIQRVDPQAL